jgi:coenzyme F420-dependent glucose-6-phosphate dehydrogenase
VVAQAFMTLEELYPRRIYLGVGSGEALNEIPCGADWPSPGEQIDRMAAALEVILALWDGKTVTTDAGWFSVKDARLYTRAAQRPKLYVSAFGPKAARVAGQYGDGVWTLGDPEAAPQVIEAYKASCSDHGRPVGEIIVHAGIAWARDEDALRRGSEMWRGTQPPEVYTDPIGTPEGIQRFADEHGYDYDKLKEGFVVSTDPDEHIEKIRAMEELGATRICLQGVSGADPMGTIELYRDTVLPALRGARV